MVQRKKCRSRQELSNEYFLAKFGFDTAENQPRKVCPLSAYRSPRFDDLQDTLDDIETRVDGTLDDIETKVDKLERRIDDIDAPNVRGGGGGGKKDKSKKKKKRR